STEHVILVQVGTDSIFRETVQTRYNDLPPMGLITLAGFLQANGYTVKVIDLLTEDHSVDTFEAELRSWEASPLIIGLSLYTETADAGLEMAGIIKRWFPDTAIAVGGPHPAFQAEQMLAESEIDYVICGEGEATLLELLECLKWGAPARNAIPGLIYRDASGCITANPSRPQMRELDLLPFPAYELYPVRQDKFNVVSSRGCPGKCLFCSSRAFSGSIYRMHSAEWLISLIFHYRKLFTFSLLELMDDTFTVNRERTKRFCALLRETHLEVRIRIKSRIDFISEEVIAPLAAAGCETIHIGVESADKEVLESISKGQTPDDILRAVEILTRYGIRIDASFMVGHPTDTLQTIEKTVIMAATFKRIGNAYMAISTPYPGTGLHQRAVEYGMTIAVKSFRMYNTLTPIYYTANFTFNDLRRAFSAFHTYSAAQLREMAILTNNRHEEYWKRMDAWVDNIHSLNDQRVGRPG
ncbi:MAG: B12-binding domain-containing radical SAM protein, partial [Acidobacteria bacterium]|nr:B12-binding domain-containing radical SAM protein [Acidobacteriota bacterium]